MKRYIANITIHDGTSVRWATQLFTAWPRSRDAAARRIAREFESPWAHAVVTSIEEA